MAKKTEKELRAIRAHAAASAEDREFLAKMRDLNKRIETAMVKDKLPASKRK